MLQLGGRFGAFWLLEGVVDIAWLLLEQARPPFSTQSSKPGLSCYVAPFFTSAKASRTTASNSAISSSVSCAKCAVRLLLDNRQSF